MSRRNDNIPMGIPVSEDDSDVQVGMKIEECPPEIRSDFIKKVYSILTVQLIITFVVGFGINQVLTPQNLPDYMFVYYLCSFGTLGLLLGVSCCCAQATRTFPTNYILLLVLTLGISVTTGFVTVLYDTDAVLLAMGATAAVFLALTFYACVTKTDFTGCGPYLFGGLMALMAFGFVMVLLSWLGVHTGPMVHKIYAGLGVLLFTFYIIYDTQLIVGGNHRQNQYSVDDYAFAALSLYLDVINLFTFILQLLGGRSD